MPRQLTATEEQIIADLREGRLDAEIAVRLGVTIGDLKQRITAILRDFRLRDRESLLDWEPPEPGDPEAQVPLTTSPGMRLPIMGLAVAAIAVGAAAVATLLFAPWEGETASPTASRTAAQVAIPPTLLPRSSIVERGVDFGHSLPLQEGESLLLKAFDTGQAIGVDRVYREAGETRVEPIWRPPDGGRFTGVVTGQHGAIAISYDAASFSFLTTSSDGGATWSEARTIEHTRGPVFTGSFGTVLSPPTAGSGSYELANDAGIETLEAPLAASRKAPAGIGPGGNLVWHASGGRLIDGEGRVVVAFDTMERPVLWISSFTWSEDDGRGLVVWRSHGGIYTSLVHADGEGSTIKGNPGWITGVLAPDRFAGNYCQYAVSGEAWRTPCYPVFYDPENATIHPVIDPRVVVDGFDPGTVIGGLAAGTR